MEAEEEAVITTDADAEDIRGGAEPNDAGEGGGFAGGDAADEDHGGTADLRREMGECGVKAAGEVDGTGELVAVDAAGEGEGGVVFGVVFGLCRGGRGGVFGAFGFGLADGFHGLPTQDGALLIGGAEGGAGGSEFFTQDTQRFGFGAGLGCAGGRGGELFFVQADVALELGEFFVPVADFGGFGSEEAA